MYLLPLFARVCVGYNHIYNNRAMDRSGFRCVYARERDCLSVVWLSYQFVWLDIEGNGIDEMNHSKTHHLYIHLFQIPVFNRSFSLSLYLFVSVHLHKWVPWTVKPCQSVHCTHKSKSKVWSFLLEFFSVFMYMVYFILLKNNVLIESSFQSVYRIF